MNDVRRGSFLPHPMVFAVVAFKFDDHLLYSTLHVDPALGRTSFAKISIHVTQRKRERLEWTTYVCFYVLSPHFLSSRYQITAPP